MEAPSSSPAAAGSTWKAIYDCSRHDKLKLHKAIADCRYPHPIRGD